MPLILHIETATDVCSVALANKGVLIGVLQSSDARSHATQLTVLIDQLCKQVGVELNQLNAVSVSKGPGSYTGLRIGVATAKGLCYGLDKPLISVNTLESYTSQLLAETPPDSLPLSGLICPMVDARRMEVYNALFDQQKNWVRDTKAEIITASSFEDELKQHPIIFFGDGASKCKEVLQPHSNSLFIDDFIPSATGQIELAYNFYQKHQFEDIVYFEPFYLKEFVGFKS